MRRAAQLARTAGRAAQLARTTGSHPYTRARRWTDIAAAPAHPPSSPHINRRSYTAPPSLDLDGFLHRIYNQSVKSYTAPYFKLFVDNILKPNFTNKCDADSFCLFGNNAESFKRNIHNMLRTYDVKKKPLHIFVLADDIRVKYSPEGEIIHTAHVFSIFIDEKGVFFYDPNGKRYSEMPTGKGNDYTAIQNMMIEQLEEISAAHNLGLIARNTNPTFAINDMCAPGNLTMFKQASDSGSPRTFWENVDGLCLDKEASNSAKNLCEFKASVRNLLTKRHNGPTTLMGREFY